MRVRRRFASGWSLAMMVIATAACGGGPTGPDSPDVTGIAASVSQLTDRQISQNGILQSAVGVQRSIVVVTSGQVDPSAAILPSFAPSTAGIPFQLLGRTMIWDVDRQGYVEEPGGLGAAPANGIRFRLYRLQAADQPVTPLQDIGFIDIIDESGAAFDVHATAEDESGPRAAFSLEGTVTSSAVDLTTTGFFSDGTQELQFSLVTEISGSSASIALRLTAPGIEVDGLTTVIGGSASTKELTLVGEGRRVEFTLAVSGGRIGSNSVASIDGEVVATVSGSLENPSVRRASGSGISQQNLDAVRSILREVLRTESTVGDLFVFALFINQGLPVA